jgi:hypothetical protein
MMKPELESKSAQSSTYLQAGSIAPVLLHLPQKIAFLTTSTPKDLHSGTARLVRCGKGDT